MSGSTVIKSFDFIPVLYRVFGRFATAAIRIKKRIESPSDLSHIDRVKATTKRPTKTEAELLDHATNNLLRAVKQKILKKEGRVDYEKLRKDGYSDRFLAKVEAA
jgi:hypothetical protein